MTTPTYDELAAVVVGLQVRIAEQEAETSPGFAHQRVKTSPVSSSGVLAVLIAPTHRSRSQSITDRERVSCRGASGPPGVSPAIRPAQAISRIT